jgi:hypothetical protein
MIQVAILLQIAATHLRISQAVKATIRKGRDKRTRRKIKSKREMKNLSLSPRTSTRISVKARTIKTRIRKIGIETETKTENQKTEKVMIKRANPKQEKRIIRETTIEAKGNLTLETTLRAEMHLTIKIKVKLI